jgi:hypothetical protein
MSPKYGSASTDEDEIPPGLKPEAYRAILPRMRSSEWSRSAGLLFVAIVLWFANIEWPFAPVPGLDSSWATAIGIAHRDGLQFGTDVQFTYGPWGYLSLNFCTPELLRSKIIWEIFGGSASSFTLILLTGEMTHIRRWIFLTASIVTACFGETTILVLITLLVTVWLVPAKSKYWQRALAVVWLSFLAHEKFTFCVLASLGIVLAATVGFFDRRWRSALAILGAYLFAYLAWWLAAQQHFGNLIPYWRQSWQISNGYSGAMFADPAIWPLAAGLVISSLTLVALWRILLLDLPFPRRIGTVVMLASGWFLAWKESFTRADMHVLGFFVYSFLMALAIFALLPTRRTQDFLLLSIALTCLVGARLLGTGWLSYGLGVAWQRIRDRPAELFETRRVRAGYLDELKASRRLEVDQTLQSIVGSETIDSLTIDDSRIFLNDLNYHPRPLIQSYSAYTHSLAEADARFFRSADAPEFVAVTLSTIDDHPAAQDDGPALAELVRRYEVVLFTPDYVLVRRRGLSKKEDHPVYPIIGSLMSKFGEEIYVPEGEGHPVWIEVEFHPTLLGKLRTFLYHASELRMLVSSDIGENVSYRVLPGMISTGFFVQPWLSNHGDFAALVDGRANVTVRSIRFESAGSNGSWFWDAPKVCFKSVTDLPLHR